MKKRKKQILTFAFLIGFIAFWILIFSFVNPQEIVAKIGVTNGYIILFVLGTLGGASTFTGPSYYVAVTTLALGGLNPFLLATIGGVGVSIGDSIIFFLGLKAGKKAPEDFQKKFEKITKKLQNKPKYLVRLLLYLYVAFTPFPNEFATIPLGLVGYKPRAIICCLILGNITNALVWIGLAQIGISWV